MTEIQKKPLRIRRKLITGVLMTVMLGGAIFFLVKGCSENISPDLSQVALKKDGKIYMYSQLPSALVDSSIARSESPMAVQALEVYKDNEEYFVSPLNMNSLIDVMAQNYSIHEFKEQSYEGYVTSGPKVAYSISSKLRSTANVGEQVRAFTVVLENSKGEKMNVEWTLNQKSGENKAVKNCTVHSFWVQTNPSPGETVISSKDFLVVPVSTLEEFFSCKTEYDPEGLVFYVNQ